MNLRRLPLLLGFLIAIGPVSTDMYLPAFPRIAADFHDAAAAQYSLAGYFVGLMFGQMTQGALSDRLGRRVPMLGGLALYILASLGCAVAWDSAALAIFRFLAALGASASIVIPRAMVRDLADGHEAAKMFSKLILVMGVAPVVAPMLGTAVMAAAGWRAIFLLAAVYGTAAIWLVWRFLPDTLPPERRSSVGFGSVLLRYGEILGERMFISHALTAAFTMSALFAYLAATPQIFIGIYGWRPAGYALLFGVNAFVFIGFNQLNPYLVHRFGVGRVISTAVFVLFAACLALALLAWHPLGAYALVAALLLSEFGFGLIQPCAMVGALSRHQAHAGSAAALLGTLQYSGGAVACLTVGVLADGSARPMGFTMLLCATLALLAASWRPRLIFTMKEAA